MSVDADGARIRLVEAEDRFEQLGASGSDEPEEADNLAWPNRQRHVGEAGAAGQRLDGQGGPGIRGLRLARHHGARRQFASDHRPDDVIRGDVAAGAGLDIGAVTKHRDPIAEPEHFGQPVRHVEQRDAAGLEPLEDGEEMVRFGVGQRGGRLVEHEDLALEGERAGDLEQLAVRYRQGVARGVWRDRQVQLGEDAPASARASRRGAAVPSG